MEPVPDQESWLNRAKEWQSHHFSLVDRDETVAPLLRKVAQYLDQLGTVDVLDITIARYWTVNAEGERIRETRASVYYMAN